MALKLDWQDWWPLQSLSKVESVNLSVANFMYIELFKVHCCSPMNTGGFNLQHGGTIAIQ